MSNESDYPAKLILESGSPDGYLLEDSSGVLIKETQGYPDLVLSDGAVCYFRFNEASGNFTDVAGGRTGTTHGSISYAQTGVLVGDTDTSIRLSTSDIQYVGITGEAALAPSGNSNNLTIEVWANTATAADHDICGIGTMNGGAQWTMFLSPAADAFGATVQATLQAKDSAAGTLANFSEVFTGSGALFHHLAFVFDGSLSSSIIYCDGVAGGSVWPWAGTGIPAVWSSGDIVLGAIDVFATNPIKGGLDEFAIYPTALTAAQIARHYRCGLQFLPDIPPPVQLAAH